jgi:glycosyltransferase involved in cell wall biosynthesis/GT2 family glycosyltransferase
MDKIDIILPICSVNVDIKQCIESIRESEPAETYNLIVIYTPQLKKFVDFQRERFDASDVQFLLYHGENQYYALANEAIRRTDNDVVILDACLVPTKNWLQKLRACAYNDEITATVTPFCNHGYICSVPEFLVKNRLPLKTVPIGRIAELVEKASRREYPEIPTAVGYCMYIKRTILNEIGLFESKTCGNGLGEDKEFSWRASQFGYKHALCDDTFLLCDPDSFPEAYKKSGVINKKAQELYSVFTERLNLFIAANPLENIQNGIKLHLLLQNGKNNILFQLHYGFEPENESHVGGTQDHVKTIIYGIENTYNCFLFFRDRQNYVLNAYIEDELVSLKFPIKEKIEKMTFTIPRISELFRSILSEFSIRLVHVHHTIYLTFDLIYQAHALGIPVILTLHDYYGICPSYNLLSHENRVCIDLQNAEYCKTCLEKRFKYSVNILPRWRAKVDEAFSMCQLLITPSKSTRDIYIRFYPHIADKIRVVPHGIDKIPVTTTNDLDISENMNVAFIGYVSQLKGSDLQYRMVTDKNDYGFRWFFFGIVLEMRFYDIQDENVYIHGIYARDELIDLLNKNHINLVCLLSNWHETFCLVLSEVMKAGIPVLASKVGALAERVEESGCGWLIPVDAKEKQVLELIDYIHHHPEEYQDKVENIKNCPIRDNDDMASEYLQIYQSYMGL